MSKLIAFVLAASVTSVSLAQDLLACVNPDVRHGLLASPLSSTGLVITPAVPAQLVDFETPAGFEFIASSESDIYTTAAFKTSAEPGEAVTAAMASLERAGWRNLTTGRPGGPFTLADQPAPASACRDDHQMTVRALRAEGTSYVTLATLEWRGTMACGEQADGLFAPSMRTLMGRLEQYMPTLEMPEGVRGVDAPFGLGGSGSANGRELERSISVVASLPITDLGADLNRQIQAQGWQLDSSWSGALAAGSVWSSRPEAGTELVGILNLVEVEASTFQVGFRLLEKR